MGEEKLEFNLSKVTASPSLRIHAAEWMALIR